MIDETIVKATPDQIKHIITHVVQDTFPLSVSKEVVSHLAQNLVKLKNKDLRMESYEHCVKALVGKQD